MSYACVNRFSQKVKTTSVYGYIDMGIFALAFATVLTFFKGSSLHAIASGSAIHIKKSCFHLLIIRLIFGSIAQ